MLLIPRKDHIDFIGEEAQLVMIWCPKCNKMLTNEYKRCPNCGKVFDDQWIDYFEEITKLEIQEKRQQDIREYNDAIKTAYKIIEISQNIGDRIIERMQFEFIAEVQMELDKEGTQNELKTRALQVSKVFDRLVEEKKFIVAHNSVLNLKKEFDEHKDLFFTIQEVRELFSKDDAIMTIILAEQEKTIKELEKYEKEIDEDVRKNDFKSVDERSLKAKELLILLIDENVKQKWSELEIDYQRRKGIYEEGQDLVKKVNKSIENASELTLKYEFDEAISMLTSIINIIKKKNENINFSEHIEKLTRKREEINSKQRSYNEKLEKLKRYEEKFDENYSKNNFNANLIYCRAIIEVAFIVEKKELVEKYKALSIEIQKSIDEQKICKDKECEEHLSKAKDLGEMVQIEEGVLPLIKDFSVSEVFRYLSDDANKILEQVSSLLPEHRAEVKTEISSRATLLSASGEIVDLKEIKEVEVIKKEIRGILKEALEYKTRSSFTNPSDDVIEVAILTDLIPYNFEIIKMQLNGNDPKKIPEKTLTKEGLELKWSFEKIQANESVEISYDLRKRVSRTIILMHDDRLKIIKVHSKLKQSETEGVYEANLPFINTYGVSLHNVVIEDIMPLHYVHAVIMPKNSNPTKTLDSTQGTFLKWQLAIIDKGYHPYLYILLEMYRYEELKNRIESITKRNVDSLNQGKMEDLIKGYKDIVEDLKFILK